MAIHGDGNGRAFTEDEDHYEMIDEDTIDEVWIFTSGCFFILIALK